jgi:hypothetical protein
LILLLSPVSVVLAQSLIVNGGFETGDRSGWVAKSGWDWGRVVTDVTHSGSYAWGTTSGIISRNDQSVPVQLGVEYTLTMWVHRAAGTTQVVITGFAAGAANTCGDAAFTLGVWVKCTISGTTNAGTFLLSLRSGSNSTIAYFDDVEMVVGAAPTATPTAAPPTEVPPTALPPTATATALPPTAIPTALPPTAIPTAVPPTATPTALPPTAIPVATPLPGDDTEKICYKAAAALRGTIEGGSVPYCWGSNTPGQYQPALIEERCPTGSGLDCSGSFIYGYNRAGASLDDATAATLYGTFAAVPGCTLSSLAACATGDAFFLSSNGTGAGVYHVSMYLGGTSWGDCYNTGTGCRVWDIRGLSSYQSQLIGVGRPSATYGWEPCSVGPGGAAAAAPGGAGGGGWGPFQWLADQVQAGFDGLLEGMKNLFIPTAADWAELELQMQGLYEHEPMGTINDLAGFLTEIRTGVAAVDVSGPSAYVDVEPTGPYAGVMAPFSITSITVAGANALNMVGDLLGPALVVIKVFSTIGCFMLLFYYIRGRFILTS